MSNVTPLHPSSPPNSPRCATEAGASSSREPGAPAPSIGDLTAQIIARADRQLDRTIYQLEQMADRMRASTRRIERMIAAAKETAGDLP